MCGAVLCGDFVVKYGEVMWIMMLGCGIGWILWRCCELVWCCELRYEVEGIVFQVSRYNSGYVYIAVLCIYIYVCVCVCVCV